MSIINDPEIVKKAIEEAFSGSGIKVIELKTPTEMPSYFGFKEVGAFDDFDYIIKFNLSVTPDLLEKYPVEKILAKSGWECNLISYFLFGIKKKRELAVMT